jgi:hypothetical protein
MTRRFILTSATLATFLTSGSLLALDPVAATPPPLSALSQPLTAPAPEPAFLTVGPHLAGLVSHEPLTIGQTWPVTVFIDGLGETDHRLALWIGRKNAWGSRIAQAQPDTTIPGLFTAQVPVPATLRADARLWLGLQQADGRVLRGAMTLPA